MSRPGGGAGWAGASPDAGSPRAQRGSQTLEFALTIPAVVLLLVVLLHAGLVGVDMVSAQGMAREAARIAAVDDDDAVREGLRAVAGRRPVRLTLDPPGSRRTSGGTVTARVRIRSRGFASFGARLWLPAEATMRVETP